jgi:16S rRNA (guanine527-N7)-methyltransferase
MFHVEHHYDRAHGARLTVDQHRLLSRYEEWLAHEGLRAGGIGPAEVTRLGERHLADSLAFGPYLGEGPEVTDIGSGAGLPGIPLAIAHPHRQFILNDRSGRRIDLLDRAIHTLELGNARVLEADVSELAETIDLAVARAVFQPEEWRAVARRILRPGGRCVIGVSTTASTPSSDEDIRVTRDEIGPEILDRAVSFLTMTKRE